MINNGRAKARGSYKMFNSFIFNMLTSRHVNQSRVKVIINRASRYDLMKR